MRAIRGARISMVMQDPKFSLNPVMTIGEQIAEALAGAPQARRATRFTQRVLAMLEAVRIDDPERVVRALSARGFRRHGPAGDDRHDADPRARYC